MTTTRMTLSRKDKLLTKKKPNRQPISVISIKVSAITISILILRRTADQFCRNCEKTQSYATSHHQSFLESVCFSPSAVITFVKLAIRHKPTATLCAVPFLLLAFLFHSIARIARVSVVPLSHFLLFPLNSFIVSAFSSSVSDLNSNMQSNTASHRLR